MPFNGRDVRRSLKKKGFSETKDKHHIYLNHYHDGKRSGTYTYISHGKDKEDVGPDNVQSMKEQLGLKTNRQVYDLVNCPLTKRKYVAVLVEGGHIPKEKDA